MAALAQATEQRHPLMMGGGCTHEPELELPMARPTYNPNRFLAQAVDAAWHRLLAWAHERGQADRESDEDNSEAPQADETGGGSGRHPDQRRGSDEGAAQEGG